MTKEEFNKIFKEGILEELLSKIEMKDEIIEKLTNEGEFFFTETGSPRDWDNHYNIYAVLNDHIYRLTFNYYREGSYPIVLYTVKDKKITEIFKTLNKDDKKFFIEVLEDISVGVNDFNTYNLLEGENFFVEYIDVNDKLDFLITE